MKRILKDIGRPIKIFFSLLFIGYYLLSLCSPLVFLAMYIDFKHHSVLGYLFMIVVPMSSFYILIRFFSPRVVMILSIIGYLISGTLSFCMIHQMNGNDPWSGYFKPLTPNELFILVSLLNVIPQFFALRYVIKHGEDIKKYSSL